MLAPGSNMRGMREIGYKISSEFVILLNAFRTIKWMSSIYTSCVSSSVPFCFLVARYSKLQQLGFEIFNHHFYCILPLCAVAFGDIPLNISLSRPNAQKIKMHIRITRTHEQMNKTDSIVNVAGSP